MKKAPLLLFLSLLLISCSKEGEFTEQVNDFFHVEVDGAQLPVKVRGNTASKKIILYIPGGPGGTGLDVSILDPGNWKEHLETQVAMAYYDQRGLGNAQGDYDERTITLAQYLVDIRAIVLVLKTRYPGSEVHLMGHSFGAILTYRFMNRYGHEGLVKRYIASSGVGTRIVDDEHWEFRRAYVAHIASNNVSNGVDPGYWQVALDWLAQHPVIDTIPIRAKLYEYMQATAVEEDITISVADVVNILLLSDNNPFPYYLTLLQRQEFINRLVDEERRWDIKAEIPLIDEDLLILGGEFDINVPPQELQWIHNTIASTNKQLLIMPGAGHDHYISQPQMFAAAVLDFVQ